MSTPRNTDNLDQSEYLHLLGHARTAGQDWRSVVGDRESPLSGEWSSESIPEISDYYDLDLFDSELADAFEEGFGA